MARHLKQGVDYFPHDTTSGKTIFILESRYGNDGYAFWFKLLELLGTQDDLSFRYENPADRAFLAAKTRVSEETATEILDLLASLDAIDPELWKHNVIWVQKLVDRLEPVFKKRKVETPQKPSFRSENPSTTVVSDAESTQSKVNKIKVNKIKVNNIVCAEQGPAPPVITFTLKDNTEYSITQDYVDELKKDYPALDVMQELRNMRAWLISNPEKRKTEKGIKRFVNGWLARTQQRASPPKPQRAEYERPINYKNLEERLAMNIWEDAQ